MARRTHARGVIHNPSTVRAAGVENRARVLVVGECPSERAFRSFELHTGSAERAEKVARRLALTGAVGRRLAGLLGEDWPDYLNPWRGARRYARANLQDVPWTLRPYSWPAARASAARILEEAGGAPVVLTLGQRVAQAFGGPAAFLRWEEIEGVLVGTLPHPSRANRWWSDRDQAEDALAFARSIRAALDRDVDPRGCGDWVLGLTPRLEGASSGESYATRADAVFAARRFGLRRFWTGRVLAARGPVTSAPEHLLVRAWLSRVTAREPG